MRIGDIFLCKKNRDHPERRLLTEGKEYSIISIINKEHLWISIMSDASSIFSLRFDHFEKHFEPLQTKRKRIIEELL